LSLRKRGNIWWIYFTAPDGERTQRSAKTRDRALAQELHDKLKSESWRLKQLGIRPRRVWQDAAARWLREQSHKASIKDDIAKLRWLDRHLAGTSLDGINRTRIDTITEAKKSEGCANATVNRTLALLRAILRRCARDWEWLDNAPAIRFLPEPSRRIRFLTRDQATTLLRELPQHLRAMAGFALLTGLRRANITGLTWEQIDFNRRLAWVHPDQAKGRKAIGVPLNTTALAILRGEIGKHPNRVFTYQGNPVFQVSSMAWYKALKRAGVENFRWHDLRHTWALWHAQQGTPLFALQEMAGWETEKMVRRYAHLTVTHLARYADNLQFDQ
jgi:integrase